MNTLAIILIILTLGFIVVGAYSLNDELTEDIERIRRWFRERR